MNRRSLLAAPLLTIAAAASPFAALERAHGGRLGVAILDGATVPVTWRGGERFPICSVYKCLAAAFVLSRVDRHAESIDRRISYGRDRLIAYSPVTEVHADADGMTLGAICAAAVELSDNTAGNLLFDSFGGPPALTAWLRSLGDPTTRLDRTEPTLNEAAPGDPRDTTSPTALATVLHACVVGTALSPASRQQLADWLVGCRTGDKRLRAGVPSGWKVGDKTGSGAHNVTNDVAVIWPPGRPAIVVVALYNGADASDDARNDVLRQVGAIACSA